MALEYIREYRTNFTNGKRHDFRLFKESGVHLYPSIRSLTDTKR